MSDPQFDDVEFLFQPTDAVFANSWFSGRGNTFIEGAHLNHSLGAVASSPTGFGIIGGAGANQDGYYAVSFGTPISVDNTVGWVLEGKARHPGTNAGGLFTFDSSNTHENYLWGFAGGTFATDNIEFPGVSRYEGFDTFIGTDWDWAIEYVPGTGTQLYINGTLHATDANTIPSDAVTQLQFGRGFPGAWRGLIPGGYIYSMRLTHGNRYNGVSYTPPVTFPTEGVAPGPTIDTQPQSQTVLEGADATFTIAATTSGGSLSYQWLFNGSPVGTDSDSYTRANTQVADTGGSVTCEVTDDNGTVTSNTAVLTVTDVVLTITQQPVDVPLAIYGSDVSFTVAATGFEPVTYQWREGGVAIPGETGTTYTRTSVTEPVSGITCFVSAADGETVESNSVGVLAVTAPVSDITYEVKLDPYRDPIFKRGELHLSRPLKEGERIEIFRDTPIIQTYEAVALEPFDSQAFEYQMDRICMIEQEIEGHACDCREDYTTEPPPAGACEPPPCEPYACDALTEYLKATSGPIWHPGNDTDPEGTLVVVEGKGNTAADLVVLSTGGDITQQGTSIIGADDCSVYQGYLRMSYGGSQSNQLKLPDGVYTAGGPITMSMVMGPNFGGADFDTDIRYEDSTAPGNFDDINVAVFFNSTDGTYSGTVSFIDIHADGNASGIPRVDITFGGTIVGFDNTKPYAVSVKVEAPDTFIAPQYTNPGDHVTITVPASLWVNGEMVQSATGSFAAKPYSDKSVTYNNRQNFDTFYNAQVSGDIAHMTFGADPENYGLAFVRNFSDYTVPDWCLTDPCNPPECPPYACDAIKAEIESQGGWPFDDPQIDGTVPAFVRGGEGSGYQIASNSPGTLWDNGLDGTWIPPFDSCVVDAEWWETTGQFANGLEVTPFDPTLKITIVYGTPDGGPQCYWADFDIDYIRDSNGQPATQTSNPRVSVFKSGGNIIFQAANQTDSQVNVSIPHSDLGVDVISIVRKNAYRLVGTTLFYDDKYTFTVNDQPSVTATHTDSVGDVASWSFGAVNKFDLFSNTGRARIGGVVFDGNHSALWAAVKRNFSDYVPPTYCDDIPVSGGGGENPTRPDPECYPYDCAIMRNAIIAFSPSYWLLQDNQAISGSLPDSGGVSWTVNGTFGTPVTPGVYGADDCDGYYAQVKNSNTSSIVLDNAVSELHDQWFGYVLRNVTSETEVLRIETVRADLAEPLVEWVTIAPNPNLLNSILVKRRAWDEGTSSYHEATTSYFMPDVAGLSTGTVLVNFVTYFDDLFTQRTLVWLNSTSVAGFSTPRSAELDLPSIDSLTVLGDVGNALFSHLFVTEVGVGARTPLNAPIKNPDIVELRLAHKQNFEAYNDGQAPTYCEDSTKDPDDKLCVSPCIVYE